MFASPITNLSESNFAMVTQQPTVVLFYDSNTTIVSRVKRLFEQLQYLCSIYRNHTLTFATLDVNASYGITARYTKTLPCIYVFLGGIPLHYQGPFNLGALHLWIKLNTQQCSCPYQTNPYPTPSPSPM